jgi:hypothetical protein
MVQVGSALGTIRIYAVANSLLEFDLVWEDESGDPIVMTDYVTTIESPAGPTLTLTGVVSGVGNNVTTFTIGSDTLDDLVDQGVAPAAIEIPIKVWVSADGSRRAVLSGELVIER